MVRPYLSVSGMASIPGFERRGKEANRAARPVRGSFPKASHETTSREAGGMSVSADTLGGYVSRWPRRCHAMVSRRRRQSKSVKLNYLGRTPVLQGGGPGLPR